MNNTEHNVSFPMTVFARIGLLSKNSRNPSVDQLKQIVEDVSKLSVRETKEQAESYVEELVKMTFPDEQIDTSSWLDAWSV